MRSSIKGVTPEWYTLEVEQGVADPVMFYIQPLGGMDWTAVLMESFNPATSSIGGAGIIKAFQLGVKNWRNIEDANKPGEQLRFSRKAMDALHPGWIMEVGKHILQISQMEEDQIKNSDSLLSSPKT
jgi:hypothetical protein